MKVFVVTEGTDPDSSVIGVYSTRSKADEAYLVYATEGEIEEYELDAIPDHPPGMLLFMVWAREDGTMSGVAHMSASFAHEISEPEKCSVRIDPIPSRGFYARLTMWARDQDHAIEIAGRTYDQMKADGTWRAPDDQQMG